MVYDMDRHSVNVANNSVFINSESRMSYLDAILLIFKGESWGIRNMLFA